ncbi:TrkA family potassium uptake protein [Halalkaliarchaeum sp. AArc-GB]|uniref:potassium channel family protein n=1 Tax=Halalkaliarchaeum sp. AArc-GB TaxID=3074078 RepID=UPI00285A76D2|nr:TrkA family potassium uptake protein [Halalkaliarchaeum sp. AArc-GB]MDR5673581.1 TrkA family potassium uptake protein [Halalkaliarchaeum sp. AArc-GB]
MYLIIVGAGKIGSNLIEMATGDGNDVVVVEQDEEVANEISSRYDCLVLNADATESNILEDAGIERADAIISTTNIDAVNTMVMLLAREYEVPSLVSVVHDPAHIPIFDKIGVNIVENPQQLIADHLYHSVRYPGIKDFMTLSEDSEFIEIEPADGSAITQQRLSEARAEGLLPEDVLVAAIKRGEDVLTPKGDTVLSSGDLVTVLVNDTSVDEVLSTFGHSSNGS